MSQSSSIILSLYLLLGSGAPCSVARADPSPPAPFQLSIWPESAFRYILAKGGVKFGAIDLVAWGPNWGRIDPLANSAGTGTGEALDVTDRVTFDQPSGKIIQLHEQVSSTNSTTIQFKYDLSASSDVPLTMLANAFSFQPNVSGSMDITLSNGQTLQYAIPNPRADNPSAPITKSVFHVVGAGDISATFDPPLDAQPESNSLRMKLASDNFPAGTRTETMTLSFPSAVQFISSKSDVDNHTILLPDSNWFAWHPDNSPTQGEIGMDSWLDGPAGKYGSVTISGDHFQLGNGKPIKFWGTNLANDSVAPSKDTADAIAVRFAKYGINCVRLHKFLNPGWEGFGSPNVSTQFDPTLLDQFDYFTAALKKRGIYYGWSPNYHYRVRPGDADQLLDYGSLHANGDDTYGIINGAPDIQNVMIAEVVALLKHRNPYTGIDYAHDPGMAFLETQNEDDIFFYTFSNLDKYPTYKRAMEARFAEWLKHKYGTQTSLAAAWGQQLHPGETVDSSVDIQTNPWFYSDDSLKGTDNNTRARLLDNASFFHHEQAIFYNKFAVAARNSGYKGPIIGSPWWGPTTLPQYMNLQSDAADGLVDRHNYYQDDNDPIFGTMLTDPGSGDLNTGLLQTAGHPFSQSEWCHVWPDIYRAEAPVIIAAYGLGLQGWDGSYEFQSMPTGTFESDAGHLAYDVWNVDVPSQIGQFPTLTRMIYRSDLREADPIAVKRVSDHDLATGQFDFSDTAQVTGDVKSFIGDVPQKALAAGKTLVEFTGGSPETPSTFPDMAKYDQGKVIKSTTGQLKWDYTGKGYITINTPCTAGIVGFAKNTPLVFPASQVRITPLSTYESIIVTAVSKEAKALTPKALITVLGRETNSGFSYYDLDNHMIGNGGSAPIMEEGVSAKFEFTGHAISAVNVLDQDGRLQAGETVDVENGRSFTIDTAEDKTIYYEVVFK